MKKALYCFICILFLTACQTNEKKYCIGVSQCSEDIWRDWQNAELKMEANFHDNVELRFASALDDSQRQIQQIDSLVREGIDLLIVAPNQLQSVSPAIDHAYDQGIPVIVFERKTDSQKYTAFVSADNYEMGRQMGEYIATQIGGHGKVMEIVGLKGSSPAADRHKGFRDAIDAYPDIQVVATLQGDWTEQTAYKVVREYLEQSRDAGIDVVFGHNDRTAMGARRALLERFKNPKVEKLKGDDTSILQSFNSSILFCGIDGLPGDDGGIQQVRDSLLDASYIYPTRGDLLLQVALDILEGRHYEKEVMLTSALVTRENANVLFLESDEVLRRARQLDLLQEKASGYLQQLDTQRTIIVLACGFIVLLLLVFLLFYLYHRGKVNIRRERVANSLWNMEVPAEVVNEESVTEDASTQPLVETNQSLFVARFKEVVEARLSDSEVTVDDLAASMNISRVQLYRRVKSVTGCSPVELLRTARLNRAHQMLITTEKTVSEVAYDVGFSAPSYFTKCFKEEFGFLPGEARKSV